MGDTSEGLANVELVDTVELVVSIAASAVFLGLSVLTAVRGVRGSTLALPTALLCADLCAYLGFEILGNLTDAAAFEWLEASAAAMAGALLFHLVLAFVGARRSLRGVQLAVYAYFGALALASLAPLVDPAWTRFAGGESWALLMLVGTVPTFGFAGAILWRHYRASVGEERLRTQLFLATIAVGVGGAASDLGSLAGAPAIPHLAGPGMLVSAVLLTALALRARFVTGGLGPSIVTASLLGVLGVLAQLVVFRALGSTTTGLVIATVLVLLVVIASARAVWSSYTEVRERTAHLATLGRLSAQMAHDLRNPLAAIRGAAQYLDEERARGSSLGDQAEFIALILEQTERLDRVIDEYRRLGRAEPKPAPTDVAALVARVVESARIAAPTVAIASDASAGTFSFDAELVTTALENLVRNAIEAESPSVTIRARVQGPWLVFSVVDDGPGMDARVLEEAVNDFFTTKAGGSGLGLAFARRVAEAHGGRLTVSSAPGRGTTVELALAAA